MTRKMPRALTILYVRIAGSGTVDPSARKGTRKPTFRRAESG